MLGIHKKLNLKLFLFEVLVIFTGLTVSFLFDEWRQDKEVNRKKEQILESILREIQSERKFLTWSDSLLLRELALCDSILISQNPSEKSILYLIKANTRGDQSPSYFLSEWKLLLDDSDPEMGKIRDKISNKELLEKVASFLHYDRSANNLIIKSNYFDDKARKRMVETGVYQDMIRSWLDADSFMNGILHSDHLINGDYRALIESDAFRVAIMEIKMTGLKILAMHKSKRPLLNQIEILIKKELDYED